MSENGEAFEIGLVGAGAISAGAYTGGVIDYIVLALDNWYAAKGIDPLAPAHEVKLSTFAGASAGSITAAIAAGYLGSDQPSIRNEEEGKQNNGKNKLFESWVDRIDISGLLEASDLGLDDKAPVLSLLDSTVLQNIADTALTITPRQQRRPYIAANFEMLLTVTNLRGVPYAFELIGDKPASYDMSLHADYVQFRFSDTKQGGLADRYSIAWGDLGKPSAEKEQLKLAALASGAFPLGLAPRTLTHTIPGGGNADWYSSREWAISTPYSVPHQCVTMKTIDVNWGADKKSLPYVFQCVDGGVINNEPLELARRVLVSTDTHLGTTNPRDGNVANKAILLIDPFPSENSFNPEYQPAKDLLHTAMNLFAALKNQARFKPDELTLAADKKVFSRFLIAPSRDGEKFTIACGSLGGFGGFLKKSFRAHDYFLGRRNAQKFLRDHFVLPEDNPLFKDWSEDMRDAHCVRDANGPTLTPDFKRLLPIIPQLGEAKTPCYQAAWPEYTQGDLDTLMKQIESRLDAVLDRLVKQYFEKNNWVVRNVAKLVLGMKKKDIAAFAQKRITEDLQTRSLLKR